MLGLSFKVMDVRLQFGRQGQRSCRYFTESLTEMSLRPKRLSAIFFNEPRAGPAHDGPLRSASSGHR